MRTALPQALGLLLLLPAAAQEAAHDASPEAVAQDPAPAEDPRLAAARAKVEELLAEGRYEAARRALDTLIALDHERAARESLAALEPRDALVPLDRALELRGEDPELLRLRAEAALACAPVDSQPAFFYEDAYSYFERAYRAGAQQAGKPGPRELAVLLEASKAARQIPDAETAHGLARGARRLRDALRQDGATPPELPEPLEQTWAQAAFARYLEVRGGDEPEAQQELFDETEDALETLTGVTPGETWPLVQLANLYQWEGRADDARERLELALELAPTDAAVNDRLFQALRGGYGWDATLEFYQARSAERPTDGLPVWFHASCELYRALEAFEAEQPRYEPAAFAAAEARFRACRELQPEYESACLQHEAYCRSAVGWCHYHRDELPESEAAFRSMEELYPGGLQAALGSRLPNGLSGLAFVARKHHQPAEQAQFRALAEADDATLARLAGQFEEAARISDWLHAYQPGSGNLANNAGFTNRDAAVFRYGMAQRAGDAGAPHRAQAVELIRRSWAAYEVAARLLPDDVRVVNDAGLVMTYYLRTDAEIAEKLLLQSVASGEAQGVGTIPWDDPNNNAREAWGDAYQNLAVLYTTWKSDPVKAKAYLEKALAIGPQSRQRMRSMLPIFDKLIAGEETDHGVFASMVWLDNPAR